MIDHHQIALQAEGMIGRQHHNAVGGRACRRAFEDRAADRACDVEPAVRRTRDAMRIDALRSEHRADPSGRWPAKGLAPAVAIGVGGFRRGDLGELGGADLLIGLAGGCALIERGERGNVPMTRRDADRQA